MKILELVKNCTRIGISGHENPDGDCAGSCCGLALYLRKVMPQAAVDIYLESMPDALVRNIPGADTIIYDVTGSEEDYDAFIILDSEPSRTGKAEQLFDRAALKINIDHHRTNAGSAKAQCYIDGSASSACELVYEVIDKEQLDAQIAKALYVGIVTDTGVFQYSNTSESTMKAAGHLLSFGFDHSAVIREVFFERTFVQARALGKALTSAERLLDGKLILCSFDRATMEELGADRKDLDGISAQLLLTQGTDASVFLHETEPGVWRASMRSVNVTDVSKTASMFAGGGHIRAAGCTIRSDIKTAIRDIKDDIARQLADAHVIGT